MIELSIIVCTYNRSTLLAQCLESLYLQDISKDCYEVIVIDNNSSDNTESVVIELSKKYSSLQYIKETTIGLSYARNTGYKAAHSSWVCYIDDDALCMPDLIINSLNTIKNFSFDSFGGAFLPWYVEKKPWWLPGKPFYFTNILNKPRYCTELTKGFITGCVAFYKKAILIELEGFNTTLGMVGNKIYYGEETELQLRMQKQGFTIGYNPNIKIKHYVAPYKLKLSWFFNSSFAVGKSYFKTFGGSNRFLVSLKAIVKSWYSVIKNSILLRYELKIIFIEMLKSIGLTFGFIASLF